MKVKAELILCCEGIHVVCPACGHKTFISDYRADYEKEEWTPADIHCQCGMFIEETAFTQWEYGDATLKRAIADR